MSILILTSVLIVALGVADILNKSIQTTKISTRSSIAYLAAESGAERVIRKAAKEGMDESIFRDNCNGGYIDLDTETCGDKDHYVGSDLYYKVKYQWDDPFHVYTSVGYYHNTRRSIETKYAK